MFHGTSIDYYFSLHNFYYKPVLLYTTKYALTGLECDGIEGGGGGTGRPGRAGLGESFTASYTSHGSPWSNSSYTSAGCS